MELKEIEPASLAIPEEKEDEPLTLKDEIGCIASGMNEKIRLFFDIPGANFVHQMVEMIEGFKLELAGQTTTVRSRDRCRLKGLGQILYGED